MFWIVFWRLHLLPDQGLTGDAHDLMAGAEELPCI